MRQVKNTPVVSKYVNSSLGICVSVVQAKDGYGVVMEDFLSGEEFPEVRVCETLAQANMYATMYAFAEK